jgi:hypothetical protein
MTLVEQVPSLRRGSLGGGREIVVDGRRVSFRRGRPKTPSHVARWKTEKARYTMLIDGDVAAARKIIACLP